MCFNKCFLLRRKQMQELSIETKIINDMDERIHELTGA